MKGSRNGRIQIQTPRPKIQINLINPNCSILNNECLNDLIRYLGLGV